MKIYKRLAVGSLVLSIISFFAAMLVAVIFNSQTTWHNFWSNLLMGIFSSALLLFVYAIVGYSAERERAVLEIMQITRNLYDLSGILEYQTDTVPYEDDEVSRLISNSNSVITYKYICDSLFICDNEFLKLKNDMVFFFFDKRLHKIVNEITSDIDRFSCELTAFRKEYHNAKNAAGSELCVNSSYCVHIMKMAEQILQKTTDLRIYFK